MAGSTWTIDGPNGTMKNNAWANAVNRILQADVNGSIIPLSPGTSTQVLYGNGVWGALPQGATSWSVAGNNLFNTNAGYVGINNSSPAYALDVTGDARISNNLYVGGGIVIADKLHAATSVTTTVLTATTVSMAGDLTMSPTSTVITGVINSSGDISAGSKLSVAGNATFSGVLKVAQGIVFDNANNGIYFTPSPNASLRPVFAIGGPVGPGGGFGNDPVPLSCLNDPGSNVLPINGWVGTNNNGLFASSNGLIPNNPNYAFLTSYVSNVNANGYIDMGGSFDGVSNNNALYINTKCNRNTNININGGTATIGNSYFQINYARFANHIEIGTPQGNINTTNIGLTLNGNQGNGIQFNTTSPNKPLIYVNNTSLANPTPFLLSANGKTQIGQDQAGVADAMLYVNGNVNGNIAEFWSGSNNIFRMKNTGVTQITTNLPNINDDVFIIKDGTQPNTPTAINFKIKGDGNTYMGKHNEIGKPLPVNISSGGNVALGVFQNAGGGIAQCTELRTNIANDLNTLLIVDRDDQIALQVSKYSPSGFFQNFKILGNGATYIGKGPAPGGAHQDALLAVFGKIVSKSVYVNTDASVWADYVFEKNYKLKSLEELENYYKENKHLPGVPSAKEIELNGDNLVETDAILLKKIEELTLYVVELKKEINKLNKTQK